MNIYIIIPILMLLGCHGYIVPRQCLPINTEDLLLNPCRFYSSQTPEAQPNINISYYMRMDIKALIEQTKEVERKYQLRSVVIHGLSVNLQDSMYRLTLTETGMRDIYFTLQTFVVKISSMEWKEKQLTSRENQTFDTDLLKLKTNLVTGVCLLSHRVGLQSSIPPLKCLTNLHSFPVYQAKSFVVLKQLKHFLTALDNVWE